MREAKKMPGLGGQAHHANELQIQEQDSTQTGRLLQALRHGPLSSFEITIRLHIAHPASPIRDLRRRGYDIRTEIHPHPSRPQERIKRYHLVESE